MTSYRDIEEDAQRAELLELAAGIMREAESFLSVVKNPKNTIEQIREFSEALIDLMFSLELNLESGEGDLILEDEDGVSETSELF